MSQTSQGDGWDRGGRSLIMAGSEGCAMVRGSGSLLLALGLAGAALAAQVRSGTASLEPRGSQGPADPLELDLPPSILQPMSTVGGLASHEGTGKALDLAAERFRNLAAGKAPDGSFLNRAEVRSMFQGKDKSGQVAAFKARCSELATKLERLGHAISLVDVGSKMAANLVEGDVSGMLFVIPQEAGKKLSASALAFAGSAFGPGGTVAGAAAGEEAWKNLGGEAYFDQMAQKVTYLERMADLAGAKVRDPAILAYMRGELSTEELRARLAAKRAEALQAAVQKWRGIAGSYPGLSGDIEAMIAGTATDRQLQKLRLFRRLEKLAVQDPALMEALRAWTEHRATPAQIERLKLALRGLKPKPKPKPRPTPPPGRSYTAQRRG